MAQATVQKTVVSPVGADVIQLDTRGKGFVEGAAVGITVAVKDSGGNIYTVIELMVTLPAGVAAQIQSFLTSNLEPQMRAAAQTRLGVTFS